MSPTARGSVVRGELVLHPVALVALALLLLNDHVLKAVAPGWVTGKLSDVAGLAFFPFLLLALRDVLGRRRPTRRAAVGAAVLTGAAFATIKLWAGARDLWSDAMALLRFPADAVVAGAGSPVPLVVHPDPTDVPAVVACAAVVVVLWRRAAADRARDPGTTADEATPTALTPPASTRPSRAG